MPEMTKMKQDLDILKKIQVLDKEIYDLSQSLLQIPLEIQTSENDFQTIKKSVDVLEERVKQGKLKQKEKELDLAQKEEQIMKLQGQLNLVKTNKEYSAIQLEIASKKADNSLLEEAILRLMDEVDLETKNLNAGKESLKQEEKKLADRKAELKESEKSFRAKIEELKAKKREMFGQVNPEVSSLYEKILAKKNGVALAPINGENCSACQMKLRPQVQNEVKLQDSIVLCENCTRILYEEI